MAMAGVAYFGRLSLFKDGEIVSSPTLAAGDVKVIAADGSVANIATLPSVSANDAEIIEYTLSADEMAGSAGDTVTLKFADQAGDEWEPVTLDIRITDVPYDVWSYATRTLTMSWASLQAVFDEDDWELIRGDDWFIDLTLSELGGAAGSDYALTIKTLYSDADDDALVLVSTSIGLERLNGESATMSQGSASVDGGVLTFTVAAVATAQLALVRGLYYDIQEVAADGTVTTLQRGNVDVVGDVTRRTTA
jgi:hypothetical protein